MKIGIFRQKKQGLLLLLLVTSRALFAAPEVTIYTYDSFSTKGSLGQYLKDKFDKSGTLSTKFVSFPSAGEALNQIAIEGKSTSADILVGVDRSLVSRATAMNLFAAQDPKEFASVDKQLWFDESNQFVPFDYGFIAVVYDRSRTPDALTAKNLTELSTLPQFRKKLAIQDPRASSIGLSFLLWTHALFQGKDLESFWKGMSNQVLTVAPGWSGSYGLFLKKEVDFVVSYSTSPAYHLEQDKNSGVSAMIFPEGHYRQVEGVGIVKSSKRAELARQWVRELLSAETQGKLPLLQFMYPAVKGITLPASFQALPVPKSVALDPKVVERSRKDWVRQWTDLMSRRP